MVVTMLKCLCLWSLLVVANAGKTKLFGSKTPYQMISSKQMDLPFGYTPVKLFMLMRHGTSSASERYDPSMIENLKIFREKIKKDNVNMKKSDIDAIMAWEAKSDIFDDCQLIPAGKIQVEEFAKRLRDTLPEIFKHEYTCDNYQVLSLQEKRCVNSGQLFLNIIFGTEKENILECGSNSVLFKTDDFKKKDPQFQLHKDERDKQLEAWETGHFMSNLARRVENKLNLEHGKVNFKILESAFESCLWETAYNPEGLPPWCKIFSDRDHEIMLYYDDMFYWYFVGHSNTFNAKLGCGVTKQLVDYFKQESGQKAIIHMALRSNILTMYAVLGLGKQSQHLKADNYKGLKEMNWTTSHVIPFLANVMVVLFESNGEDENKDPLVGIYINENLTIIELNNGTTCEFCRLTQVIDKLQKYLDDNECSKMEELNIKQ